MEQPSSLIHGNNSEDRDTSALKNNSESMEGVEFSLAAITVSNSNFDPGALINKHEYYELMRAALAEAELEFQKELSADKTSSKKSPNQTSFSPQHKNRAILLSTLFLSAIAANSAAPFLLEDGKSNITSRRQVEEVFTHESSLIYATDFLFSKTNIDPKSEAFDKNLQDLNQLFDYRVQLVDKKAHYKSKGFKILGEQIVYEQPPAETFEFNSQNNSSSDEEAGDSYQVNESQSESTDTTFTQ